MIPIVPSLSVRPLDASDHPAAAELISEWIGAAPYSRPLDQAAFEREVCADEPPVVFPASLQRHQQFGAWRAGQLIGFLDCAIGRDSDSLDLPEYYPLGLVRFLALPQRQDLINDVVEALFSRAQGYWRENGIGYVKAFHISTGYPSFQGGAGILPGDWADHVRALTMLGFRFLTRYYCLRRPLHEPLEEAVPMADLSVAFRGAPADRTYQLYHRRTDWVGAARYILVPGGTGGEPPFAHLVHIEVDPRWRRRNMARWMLRRVINDATLQGYPELVVYVAHEAAAALNLFVQHGFQELNYRGYSLELNLTA